MSAGSGQRNPSTPVENAKSSFRQQDWVDALRRGKGLYRLSELARLAGHSEPAARRAIDRLVKRRWLARVGKGWYGNMLRPEGPPTVEEAAAVLYAPAYISLGSILFAAGVIEQAPQLLTCVTTNKTKSFSTDLGELEYRQIKSSLFFGYTLERGIARARPEKAALDFIYLELRSGRQPPLDEWNWDQLDSDLLQSWLPRYPGTVEAILGEEPDDFSWTRRSVDRFERGGE